MKKLFFAFCFAMGSVIAVQAQDSTATTPTPSESQMYNQEKDNWDDKEPIAVAELPAKVREQLQGTDFSGWTTSKAYRKMKEGKTWYAVELTKGGETKMVKFDADGNKVKEKDKQDKPQE